MLPLFLGLVFLVAGCVAFYQDRNLVRNGQRADAKVVDLPPSSGWG